MSNSVKQLQNYLASEGLYAGRIDGVFGPKTLEATMDAIKADPVRVPDAQPVLVVPRIGDTQLIMDECQRNGLLRNQTAYVLATAFWETARTMKPVVEAYWLSDAWRRKNLRYYPWHGRGYVQLTWEANYKRASHEIGVDLTANPDKALDPSNAAKILVTGMIEGWFTGKKLGDYLTISKTDFVGARRIINGPDKAKSIAEIAADYDNELRAEYDNQLRADGFAV